MTKAGVFQPWSKVKAKVILHLKGTNYLDEIQLWRNEFGSIHDFSNYLRWQPEVGLLIGYKPRFNQLIKTTRVETATLSVRYGSHVDNMDSEQQFSNVRELNNFFRVNPEISRALQVNSQ